MAEKPDTHTEIAKSLNKLAKHIVERILGDKPIALDEETAAFKALTNYYAMLLKLDPPNPEEKADGSSWKSLARLGGAGGNGAKPAQF